MSQTRIEHSVVINSPASEVFGFISRAENMPRWAKYVTEAAQTSNGPVEVGTTCYAVSKVMGMEVKQDFVVTECQQGSLYAARSTSGPVPMEMSYALESVEGGTRLDVTTVADLGGFMKMAGPFLMSKLKSQLEADHADLKKILESPNP